MYICIDVCMYVYNIMYSCTYVCMCVYNILKITSIYQLVYAID